MAKDTAPSFQLYPRDLMSDPAVQAMPWDMRGRYFWALCCSSLSATPGKASEDQFRRWMDYKPSRWAKVRHLVIAAFKVDPDGNWIQKRMVQEREAQRIRHENAPKGGEARAANMTPEQRSAAAQVAALKRWEAMRAEQASSTHPMLTPSSSSSLQSQKPTSAFAPLATSRPEPEPPRNSATRPTAGPEQIGSILSRVNPAFRTKP